MTDKKPKSAPPSREAASDATDGVARARGAADAPRGRARRGLLGLRPADVDRVLYALVFAMVALVIGAVGYLVYSVIAKPAAPRTEVERRVYYYEEGVKANPKDASLWESYAAALVDAERYSEAGDVIAEGMRKLDDDAGLLVVRARMERRRGQDDAALKTCQAAIKAVAEWRKKVLEAAAARGSGAPPSASMEIIAAEILTAEIHEDRGEVQKAIDAYGRALKEKPQMADVLAARGDLHLKLGDDDAARTDYQEALRYDPENDVATNGLKKLGDAKP